MARWPQLSVTSDEQGRRLQLEWPLPRPRAGPRVTLRGSRARHWVSFWGWLFLSAVTADLAKGAGILLYFHWTHRQAFRDPSAALSVILMMFVLLAALSVTLPALRRHWRALFPHDPVQWWALPESSLFRNDPPDEPPVTRRCGVPVGPRRPSPLDAHAHPELVLN